MSVNLIQKLRLIDKSALDKNKMDNRLHIGPGEVLLQIDGKPYRIPRGLDLVRKFKDNLQVMNRTSELARQYGANFSGFDSGIYAYNSTILLGLNNIQENHDYDVEFIPGTIGNCNSMMIGNTGSGGDLIAFWGTGVPTERENEIKNWEISKII